MAGPPMRQIKIKTGVVKQLVKEKLMYEKEAKQREEKIEKTKAEDGETYLLENEKDLEETEEYKEACSVLDSVKLEA
uniref:Tubulin-specific chaperone A n=1 Tax=Vombatus ursinus TaxID=29139 RepID=A0A4X2KMB1_VOMUR